MLRKSPQPELGHTCAHPDCCGHEAAATATLLDDPEGGTKATRPEPSKEGRWGSLKRSVLWFLAFFGIYASSSVCPFCGTPGCPVGVGGAAVVGGVFTYLWRYGKSAWEKLRGFIAKRSR
jgi:hypothetical protein